MKKNTSIERFNEVLNDGLDMIGTTGKLHLVKLIHNYREELGLERSLKAAKDWVDLNVWPTSTSYDRVQNSGALQLVMKGSFEDSLNELYKSCTHVPVSVDELSVIARQVITMADNTGMSVLDVIQLIHLRADQIL